MGKVLLVSRTPPEKLPPLNMLAFGLLENGKEVIFLTTEMQNEEKELLDDKGIVSYSANCKIITKIPIIDSLLAWLCLCRMTFKFLKQLDRDDFVWVCGANTMLAICWLLNKKYKYILQLFETYENVPHYQPFLKFFSNKASLVVCCEFNRAALARKWYKLPYTPLTLPNKPWSRKFKRNEFIRNAEAREIVAKIYMSKKKMVLYQGGVYPDRKLDSVAEAISDLGRGWVFAIMGGSTNLLIELMKKYNSIVHIPFVPPPYHLQITSHAHVGIAVYDYDALGNIFCAPNKVWEYTGFGIPLLCNDVPGLINTIGISSAGICLDFSAGKSAIRKSILKIDSDYKNYSKKAKSFFDSENSKEEICKIINKLGVN